MKQPKSETDKNLAGQTAVGIDRHMPRSDRPPLSGLTGKACQQQYCSPSDNYNHLTNHKSNYLQISKPITNDNRCQLFIIK